MTRGIFQCITLLSVTILLHSCAFFKLKEEVETYQSVVGIGGEITNRSLHKKPLTILTYVETDAGRQVYNFKIIDKNDELYLIVLPAGEYYIIAFEDANDNLAYDPGEYFGLVGEPDYIKVSVWKPLDDLNIEVDRTNNFPEGFPTDISNVKALMDMTSVAAGAITTLDDEKFSEENAKLGFWQPLTGLGTVGIGVYFLEPFNPQKTPILFVHGASGSPRNFRFIAENIDRNRYQPWFYHYPSGFPLDDVSQFLNRVIKYLHGKYQFEKLYVTAHSMGGLVGRSFIIKNTIEESNDYIKLFVSISSPFGGLETAQKGVESALVAIPCWHDVVPGSLFIEKIFEQPLNAKVDYYLFFSYKGDYSYFMDNNDGAVTLRSQLDLRAQKEAITKWGFDEGHVTILSSEDVLTVYNDIIIGTSNN